MNEKRTWALALALVALLAPAVWAESHADAAVEAAPAAQAEPQLFFVWTDHVPAAHWQEYEAELEKVMSRLKATEEGKKVRYTMIFGPETGYSAVIPLNGFGDMTRVNAEFMAATDAIGGMEAWAGSNRFVDHGSGRFLVLRPELSYTPAAPREAESSGLFRHYEWWYVRPGHEAAIEEKSKELVALAAEKGSDTGWQVYQVLTGDDLPLYVVASTGVDFHEFYVNAHRVEKLLGDDLKRILGEAGTHARRLDFTFAFVRPDLSMGM